MLHCFSSLEASTEASSSQSRSARLIHGFQTLHQTLLCGTCSSHNSTSTTVNNAELRNALRLLLRETTYRSVLVLLSDAEKFEHFDPLFKPPLTSPQELLHICVESLLKVKVTQSRTEEASMRGFGRRTLAVEVVRLLQAYVLPPTVLRGMWWSIAEEKSVVTERAVMMFRDIAKCSEVIFRVLKRESKLGLMTMEKERND